MLSDCRPSEGASKNRTQIPIIHRLYLFSNLPPLGRQSDITLAWNRTGFVDTEVTVREVARSPSGRAPRRISGGRVLGRAVYIIINCKTKHQLLLTPHNTDALWETEPSPFPPPGVSVYTCDERLSSPFEFLL